jgi:hypothetical protein
MGATIVRHPVTLTLSLSRSREREFPLPLLFEERVGVRRGVRHFVLAVVCGGQ